MERMFYTLIKKDHKFGNNRYVHGRISGYKELICDGIRNGIDEPGYCNRMIPEVGLVMRSYCEPEKYDTFKDHVERYYPGLCEFDCDMSTEE